uniref:Peroxiredoxin n=1 Tax=Oryza officinalis TaxID=4535 RepID=G8JBF7_9ORYZ|nr:peroxiredoxin [Oryza officinalis]
MSLPAAVAGARAFVRSSSAAPTTAAASSSRPLLARHRRPYGSLAAAARRRHRPRRLLLQVRAARTESTGVSVGFRAPQFELPEPLTGKLWTLDDFEGNPALLVMFVCNHCPFVKHLKKDIAKLTSFYMEKGLAAVAISSNSIVTHPQDGPDYIAEEAKLYKYSFPYLYDESQEVAKAFGAVCTPEFYLFKKDGRRPFELFYHGQFDDSRPSNNVPVTGRDLSRAIDCALSGQELPFVPKPRSYCIVMCWKTDVFSP